MTMHMTMFNSAPRATPASIDGIEKHVHDMTVAQLLRGALLHDLLRCVLIARGTADTSSLHRDGTNLVQQRAGQELVLALTEMHATAIFHDETSVRSPGISGSPSQFSALTKDAPRARLRTLERLAVALRPASASAPWVTTVLWSENEQLCTPGTWSNFLAHGGWMIETLLMDPRSALRGYQRTHQLRDAHTDLLGKLLERRLAAGEEWVMLERSEFDLLLSSGKSGFAQINDILLHLKIHTPYRPN